MPSPFKKKTDVLYNRYKTPVPLNQHLLNWYVKQCSIYFPISSNHAVLSALRGMDSGWQCYTMHNVLKYMHNVLTNRTTK